jgi:hypothetical protein
MATTATNTPHVAPPGAVPVSIPGSTVPTPAGAPRYPPGVSSVSTEPQYRLEIDSFVKNVDLLNLYLLALLEMQDNSSVDLTDASDGRWDKDPFSYFNLAALHGNKPIPWTISAADLPSSRPSKLSTEEDGYCPHSSRLFPTWHRVYLLAFEVYSDDEATLILRSRG